jgi:release factor glutamine methyltransferase
MKCGDALASLKQHLEAIYDVGEAAALTSVVGEALTGASRNRLQLHHDRDLSAEQQQRLNDWSERLLRSEPVQYVLEQAPFYHLNLYVNRTVLIPRPETEELVHWILTDLKAGYPKIFEQAKFDADQTDSLKILDVGTGSGCIALALKSLATGAEVWGCDQSEEALNVARRNGSELNIRVDFQGIDFLDEEQQRLLPSVDLLVSNPPYIPELDKDSMHANVLRYEPHEALFVPDNDPLVFYRAIARFGHKRLHTGGNIYLEIHESLGEAVCSLLAGEGYESVELRKDMQGKDRMVRAKKGAA